MITQRKALLLGFNIDHIATLRQVRRTDYPDPIQAACIAAQTGADEITLHLREDRRHIQDRDVERLKQKITIPINLEIALTEEMLNIAEYIRPEKVCLVPEKRTELTTEGGLDVVANLATIKQACQRLAQVGCEVSLFIAVDKLQIDAAKAAGAPVIEIHTGIYANADGVAQLREYQHIVQAVDYAASLNLVINAGHGLHYHNTVLIASIPQLHTLNIGHAIIAQAVFVGLPTAVREMKVLMRQARNAS